MLKNDVTRRLLRTDIQPSIGLWFTTVRLLESFVLPPTRRGPANARSISCLRGTRQDCNGLIKERKLPGIHF